MTVHGPIVADETASFVALLADMDEMRGPERYDTLIEFARSRAFYGCGMLLEGHQGAIHREAYMLLRAEMDKETPGRAWEKSYNAADRAVICRHLKIDAADPLSGFATFPFRVIRNEGDRPWIAAAIGCAKITDADHLRDWLHLDIQDVILWNPRTAEVKLAGDTGPTLIHAMDYDDGRYAVFADGFAFFRAWAEKRAILAAQIQAGRQSNTRIIPRERDDNELPGILAIGDLDKCHWKELDARVLVAGPGIDPDKLKRAIFRAARLPSVEAL